MNNLVAFLNSFLSYLLLFGAFVLIAAVAIAIGITLRKSKNLKVANADDSMEEITAEDAADTVNE